MTTAPEELPAQVREILSQLKSDASTQRTASIKVEQTIVKLHAALGALTRESAPWIATFLDEGTMIDLGASLDMASMMAVRAAGAQQAVQNLTSVALGAIANGASGNDTDRMADAIATGMTESAVACTCGTCQNCKLVDARGPEIAIPEIQRRMRSMLVVPRDKIRGTDRRIKLPSEKN